MTRTATIARALTLGNLTISTTKGSHTGTLAEVCAWQAEHQGALADIGGVDVADLDFDVAENGDDTDEVAARNERRALARLVKGAIVLDLGTVTGVAHAGIAEAARAAYDAADDTSGIIQTAHRPDGMIGRGPIMLLDALRDLGVIFVDEDGQILADAR